MHGGKHPTNELHFLSLSLNYANQLVSTKSHGAQL